MSLPLLLAVNGHLDWGTPTLELSQPLCSCRCSSSMASTRLELWVRRPMTRREMPLAESYGLLGYRLLLVCSSWVAPSSRLINYLTLKLLRAARTSHRPSRQLSSRRLALAGEMSTWGSSLSLYVFARWQSSRQPFA